MWGHTAICPCAVCSCLPRIFHLIGSRAGQPNYSNFLSLAARLLRNVEAELRDELARVPQGARAPEGVGAAPPAQTSTGETATSQVTTLEGESPLPELSSKGPPPLPPPHLHPAPASGPLTAVKKEPSVSRKSLAEPGVEDVRNSAEKERARSSGRRRRRRSEESHKGRAESPRPHRRSRSRRDRDRDRRRRRSSSRKAAEEEGGKEKKKRSEKPPEPEGPPPGRDRPGLVPHEPSYPPPQREQGRGWTGEVPRSSHPRWTHSQNKGVVKRAKQELHSRRGHR
eukprot:s487_g10.t1